jgi:hypothetical protein
MNLCKYLFFVLFIYFKIGLIASQDLKDTIKTIESDSNLNIYKPDYYTIFKYQYPKAILLYRSNICLFDSICHVYQIDTAIAVSIVFPEFIRYLHYQDVIESLSLEMVYVKLGKDFIDFSVGPMQMKPSFAEDLESISKKSTTLSDKYKLLTTYHSIQEDDIRRERLDRMKTLYWQMIYICLFYDVVSARFKNLVFKSKEQKIRFFAAAYNSDFQASANKIFKQIKNRCFPDGKQSMVPQYSYSDVALDFYQNYYAKP